MKLITGIILASASPRRRELLQRLGLNFEVKTSSFEERADLSGEAAFAPEDLAERLAAGKARDVAEKYPDALVIAADTVVTADGQILGKPQDEAEAAEILRFLSGKWHQVHTGLALCHRAAGKDTLTVETTMVHFRALSGPEIDFYVKSGEPMDKAGAYGIQGLGAVLVDRIEGCFFNVMGLPLTRLTLLLKDFGINLLGGE